MYSYISNRSVGRVVALGDSILKGVVYSNDRYSVLKESFICQSEQLLGIEVNNLSRFGSTVTRGISMLSKAQSLIEQADITLLKFGGNDADFNWKEIADYPSNAHFPHTEIPEFRRTYLEMIDHVRSLGSQPVMLSLPLVDGQRIAEFVTRNMNVDERQHIYEWLGGHTNRITYYHEMYNLEVFRIAEERQVPLIDLSTPFLRSVDYLDCLCDDGMHPSQLGHNLMALAMVDYWKKLKFTLPYDRCSTKCG